MRKIYPVILSGGSGTRLWPLSRAMYPKQFINFFGDDGHSFLASTLSRLTGATEFQAPILLCNNDHRFLVKQELESARIDARAIVLEPVARNTAAAIAVAAKLVLKSDPDGIMVVMPSDHAIRDHEAFAQAVRNAAAVASSGQLVLFGIRPHEPHTGYGYIRCGEEADGKSGPALDVVSFTEKPDTETAKRYLSEGGYLWNSGIFVLHARTFLDELERYEPEVASASERALEAMEMDLGFMRLDKEQFEKSPSISVDYAVMERTDKAKVLPLELAWSDVGSYSSLWDIAPRDNAGNHVHGDAILEDTENCFIHSQRALVSTIGVRDLVIVETPDAVLIADKARAQDVSKVVARLKADNRTEHEQHVRNFRPWGYFETLAIGTRFQVKKLHVKPGGKLSMQMHHHRSEHWVVVQGTASVTIGDKEQFVRENESVYIVSTQWHRLENKGKVPLEIIEVQIGTYLGEDDIKRADDIYKRAPDETK